jgi:hypothetical protein
MGGEQRVKERVGAVTPPRRLIGHFILREENNLFLFN